MVDPPLNVLVLAGRLGAKDDGRPIQPFLERLNLMGVSAQVLCTSSGIAPATDVRIVEYPPLKRWWQQAIAIRRLRLGETLVRPDLLHVVHAEMSAIGLAIAEHWEIPYVQTVDEFIKPGGRLSLSRRWCRRLVAVSHEVADDLVAGLGIPRDSISVVKPGIFQGDEGRKPDRTLSVPVIGTSGPLVASSGLVTFLNAARRVLDAGVDAEFVIAGQGEDEVDLRRRTDRLRIADRVTFAGTPVVGLRYWDVLDVYCQTSIVPTVGRPLAMALALGVPSIASDIEGLRSLVSDRETGLRVPPEDPAALGQAILELLADPDFARKLGEAGRQIIRRDFHPDLEASQLVALYRDVAADHDNPPLGRSSPDR